MTLFVRLFIAVISFVGGASLLYAQVSVSLSLSPRYPSPHTNVTLSLKSYSFNVNTATIVWKQDGKVLQEGLGDTSYTMRTGDVGESSLITVSAKTADGFVSEQSITVTPSSIALLYEAPQSYVPQLYEGRSLPSDAGLVRITAIPSIADNGEVVPPSSLSYTWYAGETLLKNNSGIGKQTLTTRLDYLQTKTTIKVLVESPLGNRGEKTIDVYPHEVMPLLYVYDSLLGTLFTHLVEKRFEITEAFTLSLEPFYVSVEEDRPPEYNWYLNGVPFTPLGGRILSFDPQENSQGSKSLQVSVAGGYRKLQKGETFAELVFDTRK